MSDTPKYAMPFYRRDQKETAYLEQWQEFLATRPMSDVETLMNFPMFAPRQDLARFLFRADTFRQVLDVHGSIIECGVAYGGGLMAYAQLSAILEPYNYSRKVVGFDTFSGFPSIHGKDKSEQASDRQEVGEMATQSDETLAKCVDLFDLNRPLGHLGKVELVKGDILETVPQYVEDNPHLVVSLLYLDADLYEPTKIALEHFVPRMPKGAVIAFDEVNDPKWPGETVALLEVMGIRNLELKRVGYDTTRCYAII